MTPRVYTFYAGNETVDSGAYGTSYLWNQEGYSEASEDDLRAYYDQATNLQQTFGDFNTYLQYMNERQDLIDSGEYDVGSYGSIVDTGGLSYQDPYGNSISSDDYNNLSPNDFASKYGLDKSEVQVVQIDTTASRKDGYYDWLNSDPVQALNSKYGISNVLQTDDGREYQWNGSGWVKTKEREALDFGDIAKIATAAGFGALAGPAIGSAIGGALGTGAAGTGALKGAASAFLTGAANGDVTAEGVLTGAVTGGLTGALSNSGGMLGGLSDGAISPELQNSLDILRESNPDRYLEALEILNNATQQGGSWLDALGSLADIGVEVGNIVWDANNNDGEDAAEPTVDDDGELIFDGGDVSINIPDYSLPDADGGLGDGGGAELGEAPPWGWVFDVVTGEWSPIYSEEEAIALPGDPEISVGESKPGEDIYGDDVGEGQAAEEESDQGVWVGLPGGFPGSQGPSEGSQGNDGEYGESGAGTDGIGSGQGSGGEGNGNGNGDGDGDGDGNGLGDGLGLLAGLGGGGSGENYRWQPIAGLTRLSPYQKRRHTIYNSLNEGLLKAALQQSRRA